ncbi:chemotaxis protein CheW [Xanthobacter sp. KR7-65]|uniref:chemotaxis protein CheW n=1 Tax=Xanthobacter sp. KR7-65 TaxID=3156612 RepID=UPI0032B3616F
MNFATKPCTVVVVRCGELRIGVPVSAVRKVVAAPLPQLLPGAPVVVAGLVNLHGTPLVVLDLARRGAAARDGVCEESRIVVVETADQRWGLLSERVEGTMSVEGWTWQDTDAIVPGTGYIAGGIAGEPGVLVLRDPAVWLARGEAGDLSAALAQLDAEAAGAHTAAMSSPIGGESPVP